ncbi:DUF6101 family protein [Methylobacterium sp. A54F]
MTVQTHDHLHQDGIAAECRPFRASPLPVLGGRAEAGTRLAGVALAFADADEAGERFALLLVDAEGEVASRLGPFEEEDVVALWRDLAAKSGLPRMVLREDGVLAPVGQQIGRVALGRTRIRRRHGLLGDRRPRFLVRRKTGRLPVRPLIHRGEKEIIARS